MELKGRRVAWPLLLPYDLIVRFLGAERLAVIGDARHKIHKLLKRIIALGVAEGEFDPKIDASFAPTAFCSLQIAPRSGMGLAAQTRFTVRRLVQDVHPGGSRGFAGGWRE
jgi:hypothetical protein